MMMMLMMLIVVLLAITPPTTALCSQSSLRIPQFGAFDRVGNSFPYHHHHHQQQHQSFSSSILSLLPLSTSKRQLHVLRLDLNDDRNNKEDDIEANVSITNLAESDKLILGIASTAAGLITLYSEYVLKSTGCGLPAGPFGLIGAAEGLSYLGVVATGALSLYEKLKTGTGLPSGPRGILGLGEGLSITAIIVGLIVLVFQVVNYGYIPNAVPMEGAMCK